MKDKRIDAIIKNSAEFAQPILIYLREIVHETCPDVEETLKWGMPHFMYKGILCSMAAFKAHCVFGFWKWDLIAKKFDIKTRETNPSMGLFGRITDKKDLPEKKVIINCIKEAMRLNDENIKSPVKTDRPKEKKELEIPNYFTARLKENKKALKTFEAFSYSHKKEYVEWITEAKTEETREKRLETAIEWMTEGKSRNWKHMKR